MKTPSAGGTSRQETRVARSAPLRNRNMKPTGMFRGAVPARAVMPERQLARGSRDTRGPRVARDSRAARGLRARGLPKRRARMIMRRKALRKNSIA